MLQKCYINLKILKIKHTALGKNMFSIISQLNMT